MEIRGIFDTARTVCSISGWNLTNLQLQKMMYIIQMFHIGIHDAPLFAAHFEAWPYGPVEPVLYKKLSCFGGDVIPKWWFSFYDTVPKDSDDFEFMKEIINTFNDKTPAFLVNYTYDPINGAWNRKRINNEKHPITNQDILEEYERRFKK